MTRNLLPALLLFMAGTVAAPLADPEIEYLLQAVGESGCTFIRNGREHSSPDAEDHLRLKYRNGRKHIDTAESFIAKLASRSSWTGKVYYVRCGEAERQESADWLFARLAEWRAGSQGSPP